MGRVTRNHHPSRWKISVLAYIIASIIFYHGFHVEGKFVLLVFGWLVGWLVFLSWFLKSFSLFFLSPPPLNSIFNYIWQLKTYFLSWATLCCWTGTLGFINSAFTSFINSLNPHTSPSSTFPVLTAFIERSLTEGGIFVSQSLQKSINYFHCCLFSSIASLALGLHAQKSIHCVYHHYISGWFFPVPLLNVSVWYWFSFLNH